MGKGLSKSRIISYRQCPKRLYLEIHRRDLLEEPSPDLQRIFDTGHRVGELAQTFYPEGMLIGHDTELSKAVDETKTYLTDKGVKTLFEATFNHQQVLVRADLLHKTTHGVHIQEVKSAASVKEVNVEDCAIQVWVIEGAGYPVNQIDLTHINSKFVYQEEGNYEGIFIHAPLTDMVREIQPYIGRWVKEAFETIEADEEPDIHPGEQCTSPYTCPFIDYCDPETTAYPVECLPNGRITATKLRNEGIEDIRDIPADWLTSERQECVRRVTIAGQYELDDAARLEMLVLDYPRYYIDFESINPTIPLWVNTSPFQQIVFQWSCHIENEEGEILHEEYLDTTGEDPRRAFIETLIETLGDSGSILVYNATFEKTRLKESAVLFPEYKEVIDNILIRIVDLLPIARKFYYHPAMKGKWSIKSVLPTIAPELDYSELEEVHHGMEAQDAYLEVISPATAPERKGQLKKNLLKYCELDTLAMVKIAHFFEKG